MSLMNYHYILRNNPEDRRSQNHCAVTCADGTNVYLISVYTILMGGTKPVSVVIITTEVGIRLLESKEIFCSLSLTCSPPIKEYQTLLLRRLQGQVLNLTTHVHPALRLKTVHLYVHSCLRLQDRVYKIFLKSNFVQN